ncbi:MAG: hypothetical protein U0003_00345 [Vampirovibrionales bacterium]
MVDTLMAQQRWSEALEIASNALAVANKPTIGHTLGPTDWPFVRPDAAITPWAENWLKPGNNCLGLMERHYHHLHPLMRPPEAIGQLYQALASSQPDANRQQQQAVKAGNF